MVSNSIDVFEDEGLWDVRESIFIVKFCLALFIFNFNNVIICLLQKHNSRDMEIPWVEVERQDITSYIYS